MALHPLAGTPAPASALIDVERLEHEFMTRVPDLADPRQRVKFGTSGHRGTSLDGSLTAAHIAAITQAICDYRRGQEIDGLLYMGMDTHALSEPSQEVALQVLAANGVEAVIQRDGGFTPTPVVSRAIIVRNRGRKTNHADGIVITPSHNPPEDGGFKYNPRMAGLRTPTSRGGFKTAPTNCSPARDARSNEHRWPRRSRRRRPIKRIS